MLKKYLKYIIAFAVVVALLVAAGICTAVWGAKEGAATNLYASFWSLIPPVIAIFLALVTKEVFSSLFIGVLAGVLMYANFKPVTAWDSLINNGFVSAISGTAGIFMFLVLLGIMVALVNSSGGAAAFGRWATKNIKTRVGAMLATFVLGVLIFIDDYFNCLTVGSVMKPITDKHRVSRAKLSYLIDATAAPICMIAPISSWAAAVATYIPDGYDGMGVFIQAIPYNFYSLLTFVFVIAITLLGLDYGPMKMRELAAIANGDLGPTESPESNCDEQDDANSGSRVIDLILPIIVLIVACVATLLYYGGMFTEGNENYGNIINAFSATDATIALPSGALLALVFTMIYLIARKRVTFKQTVDAIPKGFIAMVPAILILTFAISLKNTTSLLGSDVFVENILSSAEALKSFLPAIIFILAAFVAFSTGTSWGTFGILIPIVVSVFPNPTDPLFIIGISACLAGAVCGDHCSPISDTTIMASAGANSEHITHVNTQLPYAMTVAAVSFVTYIIAGILGGIKNSGALAYISLPIGIVLMLGTVIVINEITKKKAKKEEA